MAIPGDTACAPVADCGTSRWGNIARTPETQHVDASFTGVSDGSEQSPWSSLQAGIDAASEGAIVAVAAGTYAPVTIHTRKVTVWGRCPSMVELTGSGETGVTIIGNGSGSQVRALGVRGAQRGAAISGVRDVVFEEVWFHDLTSFGFIITDEFGETSAVVRTSLIEHATGVGVYVEGAVADLSAIEVRDTQLDGEFGWAVGVLQNVDTLRRGAMAIRSSWLHHNAGTAIGVLGSDGDIEAVAIYDMQPDPFGTGRALTAQPDPETAESATVVLRASDFRRNQEIAMAVTGSTLTAEALTIRDTLPQGDGTFGRGAQVQPDPTLGVPASMTMRTSRLAGNHDVGLLVVDAYADIESVLLTNTLPQVQDQLFGDGVVVFGYFAEGSASIVGSRIEYNTRSGVSSFGGTLSLGSTAVTCNPLALNGEQFNSHAFAFDDLGGNDCGCGGDGRACQIVSAQLAPPVL
jgi:hypothetical protein